MTFRIEGGHVTYHSITCEDPCPGWGCACPCHPCLDLPEED